jgi:hypothetical protein
VAGPTVRAAKSRWKGDCRVTCNKPAASCSNRLSEAGGVAREGVRFGGVGESVEPAYVRHLATAVP